MIAGTLLLNSNEIVRTLSTHLNKDKLFANAVTEFTFFKHRLETSRLNLTKGS